MSSEFIQRIGCNEVKAAVLPPDATLSMEGNVLKEV